jgi:hypothetical protein
MRVGEPLVTSTNQGSATKVMALPIPETASATVRETSVLFHMGVKIDVLAAIGARAEVESRGP